MKKIKDKILNTVTINTKPGPTDCEKCKLSTGGMCYEDILKYLGLDCEKVDLLSLSCAREFPTDYKVVSRDSDEFRKAAREGYPLFRVENSGTMYLICDDLKIAIQE